MKIRPGSRVCLNFDGSYGGGIHVTVKETSIEPNGQVLIESVTDLGSWMTHSAMQYAESATVEKF